MDMAEKKVSGKKKTVKPEIQRQPRPKKQEERDYDEFVEKYGSDLRKRSTRKVSEPRQKRDAEDRARDSFAPSRCEEIDPHTTVNPVADHQILTKRTGRILSDDTGFRAQSYNQRFELKSEMPETTDNSEIEGGEFADSAVPGQQTMTDFLASSGMDEASSAPIEGKIVSDEDPFVSVYQAIKAVESPEFGKSEKLRAIARTAADDADMSTDSQLVFPAFDPLFRFPDEQDEKKKKREKKHKHKNKKKEKPQETASDIEETDLVTNHEIPDDAGIEDTPPPKETAQENRFGRFLEMLKDNEELSPEEPIFEAGNKEEIRPVSEKLRKSSRTGLLKTGILLFLGTVLMIVSFVFGRGESTVSSRSYAALNLVLLLTSGAVCIKELAEGLKHCRKLKFSPNAGVILIFLASLAQTIFAFFADDPVHLFAPIAVYSLMAVTLPVFLLANHSRLTVGLFAGNYPLSVLKSVSDSGMEGAVKAQFAPDGGTVKYAARTQFATGLMKKLTNAIPKPFGRNVVAVFSLFFSLLTGVAYAIIAKNIYGGLTTFTAMLTVSLPVTYAAQAAWILYHTDVNLAEQKSSLLSYRSASELTQTKAFVVNAADVIEQNSCMIHGIKTFGRIDPRKATLYCASVINAGGSPLAAIMEQVTQQSEEEVPEATEIFVTAGAGLSGTVDHHRVILGSRAFLEENHILLPDTDFEAELITGDRKLLYLAVNGEFCMVLIVSYHIKRSVSAFFKYLAGKGIAVAIYSADPNINSAYLAKKCRLDESDIPETDDIAAAYFRDRESKVEAALPADVFTDGQIASVFALVRKAFSLDRMSRNLPVIVYALCALGALLVAVPVFLGGVSLIGNFYLLLIQLLSFALGIGITAVLAKQK